MRPGDARRQAAVMEDIKSSQPDRGEDEVLPQREAIVEVNVLISISVPRGEGVNREEGHGHMEVSKI